MRRRRIWVCGAGGVREGPVREASRRPWGVFHQVLVVCKGVFLHLDERLLDLDEFFHFAASSDETFSLVLLLLLLWLFICFGGLGLMWRHFWGGGGYLNVDF